ncbi:hypothetical protein APHWI1_1507 [Anaplasma phagocytophilum str. ApWI1]|uniref:Uncharacterized protein n=1 Tax=Anaplasma phagocytophilum str. ApWI1 TaxID=1359155 RepID=A0A0F3PYC5_ANAPH|nr:hypothetical protein APHWI1_1507 [Anaplasma phagocytophilum str. ApWI1]KJV99052.1 hypothetical protein OTSANNIE_0703 [Anaplasma phagocytophilum str. Annie]
MQCYLARCLGLESALESLDIKCLSLSLWDAQERNSSL